MADNREELNKLLGLTCFYKQHPYCESVVGIVGYSSRRVGWYQVRIEGGGSLDFDSNFVEIRSNGVTPIITNIETS